MFAQKRMIFFLFWEIDMEGMTRFILGILHFRLCTCTGFQVASAGYKIKVYLDIAPTCQNCLMKWLFTPPVAEILCAKNGRAIVVLGF